MVYKTGSEEWWRKCGIGMGDAMKDLLWILEAVDTGVDMENYPRAMFQASVEVHEQQQPEEEEYPQQAGTQ